MQGIDASLRIQLFQIFNFAFIPICLVIGVLFCYFFTSKMKNKENDENISSALSFLNSVSICAFSLTVIFILNKYNILIDLGVKEAINSLLQQYSILALPFIISVATLIYIKHPFVKFEVYRLGIFVIIGLTLFVNFLFQSNTETSAVRSLFRFYVIFAILTVIVLLLLKNQKFADFVRLSFAFVPLSYGMLFAGLSLEVFNILNQHGAFIVNRAGSAKWVFTLFAVLSALLFALGNKKFLAKLKAFPHWETISIIGLVLSLYYFTAIPPLYGTAETELFEQANHGLLVNDFLAWGKLPMINSFDAHTLSYSLGMLVYGVLNGDVLGASYYGYSFVWLIPTALCTFLLYKNIFDKYFAFFFMLIAPNIGTLNVSMCVVSIIALLYVIKKRSFGAYLWLFFSVVIGLVYSIPTGFAYGGAAVIVAIAALGVGIVKERKFTSESKSFLKALGIFTAIMVVFYVGVCLQQGINPIKRGLEFLGIAKSTNTWSYASLGDQTSFNFGLLYSVLPVIVVACLIWLITHFQNKPVCYASCAFLLSYIINCTRSLQRHTLAENNVAYVIFTAVLGIALFLATVIPKHKRGIFVASGLFVVTAIFTVGTTIQGSGSVARSAIATANSPDIFYDGATSKTTRVNLSAPFETHKNVIGMINSIIPEGETYLDLSGQTMLYALSGREKPVYAAQSVTEISGDYAQKRLIEEVEEDYDGVCDFALVNTVVWTMNIDGVPGFYRYYYVMEYLYDNYRPLCKTIGDYTLWVRKSRYNEFVFDSEKSEYAVFPLTIGEANWTNGLTIESESPLVLNCSDKDPFINIPLESPVTIAPANDVSYEIELTYKSSVGGTAQVFFDYAGYNEADSSKASLSAATEYTVAFIPVALRQDITELKAIRLDPPSGSEFEIKSIRVVGVQSDKTESITFASPIRHSDLTDDNWTNGVLNVNPNHMLFPRNEAEALSNATVLYSSAGSANVTNIIVNTDWVRVETDKDASLFADGVTAADINTRNVTPIGYEYLGTTHLMNLAQIPYLWGQYDTKKAWKSEVIASSDSPAAMIGNDIQQNAKYALININSPVDGNGVLSFQNSAGENVSMFDFSLVKGENRYIVRCSTDWWWNRDVIASYSVGADVEATFHNISFLVGD